LRVTKGKVTGFKLNYSLKTFFMNSKTKLFNLSLTVILILMHSLSFAQTFKYAKPNFKVTLPTLTLPNLTPPQYTPCYTLFIETGNGRYYKNNGIRYVDDGVNTIPPCNISYDYNILVGSEAILKLVRHYDTIKPPSSLFTYRPFLNSSSNLLQNQNELPTGNKIGFNYSDKVAIPGDTMTVVLTYKPDKFAS
jgi:hypothetical protein